MKIAVCSPISLTTLSGAAKFLIEASKLMSYSGHDVQVYAFPFGSKRAVPLSKVQELLSPVPYHETKNIDAKADIVYVNYAPLIWRKMKLGEAKIAGLHTHLLLPNQHLKETLTHPREAGYDWYIKAVSFAFFLSAIKADLAAFDAAHIPLGDFSLPGKTKLYKIPLWIDLKKIHRKNQPKYDRFTVLFVGRKTWEKGWLTFCKIAEKLGGAGNDFSFLCSGQGEGHVQGLGFLNEDELFDVYQRSHVVVYPSIADVFGLVILEAAACGIPVVTTPIGVHIDQGLPLLYASDTGDFIKSVLRVHALWKEEPDRYADWCNRLQISAMKYDVSLVFPLFEEMLKKTLDGRDSERSRFSQKHK